MITQKGYRKTAIAMAIMAAFAVIPATQAADDSADACHTVRLSMVNWTGVTIKTKLAQWMLDKLGYQTKVRSMAVPVVLRALAKGDSNVFVGLWIPSQRPMASKYFKSGEIDIVTKNMPDGKYDVAVNKAAWDAGVHSFADLAKYADKFDHKIYGIEAGNEGNGFIKAMIKDDHDGMHVFKLVPSSEATMLTEVKRRIRHDKWVAWLAWAPHPMNINIKLKYLDGGAAYFGPHHGAAAVYTLAHKGFAWKCPNVGQFFENYHLTSKQQSLMASFVVNKKMDPKDAGLQFIKDNPKILEEWLGHGGTYQTNPVKTADGKKNALDVIRKALDLKS